MRSRLNCIANFQILDFILEKNVSWLAVKINLTFLKNRKMEKACAEN